MENGDFVGGGAKMQQVTVQWAEESLSNGIVGTMEFVIQNLLVGFRDPR